MLPFLQPISYFLDWGIAPPYQGANTHPWSWFKLTSLTMQSRGVNPIPKTEIVSSTGFPQNSTNLIPYISGFNGVWDTKVAFIAYNLDKTMSVEKRVPNYM